MIGCLSRPVCARRVRDFPARVYTVADSTLPGVCGESDRELVVGSFRRLGRERSAGARERARARGKRGGESKRDSAARYQIRGVARNNFANASIAKVNIGERGTREEERPSSLRRGTHAARSL